MPLSTGDILVYDGTQWVTQKSLPGPFAIDSPTFYVDSTNDRVGIGTTSPNSTLHVAGSVAGPITVVSTSPYYAAVTDNVILVDASSDPITVYLPSGGARFSVICIAGSSSDVTVVGSFYGGWTPVLPLSVVGYGGYYYATARDVFG